MKRRFLARIPFVFLFLFMSLAAYGDELETHDTVFPSGTPWFTGPLLAPSAATAKPKAVSFYPYFNTNVTYGRYNTHWKIDNIKTLVQNKLITSLKTGVTDWMDVAILPEVISNRRDGSHDINIGDMPLIFGIQLFRNSDLYFLPDVKLGLACFIPFGKYDKLNPDKNRTDATGIGSWSPAATLSTSKLWQIKSYHYVSARIAFQYRVGTTVHVKGINTYGGTVNTSGRVYPGNQIITFLAGEYNFTRHWAVACDFLYVHRNRNRFSGKIGAKPTSANNMQAPSREEFSLAPALEYNWSSNMGLIAGAWFSMKGRNSPAFVNWLISYSLYFPP